MLPKIKKFKLPVMSTTTFRYNFHKKYFLLLLLIKVGVIANAQKWQNPSEKYTEAYKLYLGATCPIKKDSIRHFVYFARDRQSIIDHPLLSNPMFEGAQIMYSWKNFEPQKGQYDFSILKQDYEYLKKFNKKLFLQIQDITFDSKYKALPDYLLTYEYDGGAVAHYSDNGKLEGWVAKRWNKKVRERFALLLHAIGQEYDGKIEGINLQETAVGVKDASFSEKEYLIGLKENMLSLKKVFRTSTTMIYANFMPGEWLPFDDKGYLRSIYKYGEQIGVGIGGPDLMVTRKGQLNHLITLLHEEHYSVPIGIAIQDGNYMGKTGNESTNITTKNRKNIVPLLHAFAKDFLKVNYMFWTNQPPYFEQDLLPCFSNVGN